MFSTVSGLNSIKKKRAGSLSVKIGLLYQPTFLLLGINLSTTKHVHTNSYTRIFITALFTVVKKWKEPNVHQQMNI